MLHVPYLVWMQDAHSIPQFIGRQPTVYKNRIRKGPILIARINLRDLRVDSLHVRTSKQTRENVLENIYSRMRTQIATDGADVVIAVEKFGEGDNCWLLLGRQPFL